MAHDESQPSQQQSNLSPNIPRRSELIVCEQSREDKHELASDMMSASGGSELNVDQKYWPRSNLFSWSCERKTILWCLVWISAIAMYVFSYVLIQEKYSHLSMQNQFERSIPLDRLRPREVDRLSKQASNNLEFILKAFFLGRGDKIRKKDALAFGKSLHKNLDTVIDELTLRDKSPKELVSAKPKGKPNSSKSRTPAPSRYPDSTSTLSNGVTFTDPSSSEEKNNVTLSDSQPGKPSLSPTTEKVSALALPEDQLVLQSEITGRKVRAKYAVSVTLQLGPSFALGMGLVNVLAIYYTLWKLDGDKIDMVVWLSDPKYPGRPAWEICGDDVWRWLQKVPGLYIESGSLCSEFGYKPEDIHVYFRERKVAAVIFAQMTKIRAITLDTYERVLQLDWDTLPFRSFLKIFSHDMQGAKVLARTDELGPLYGSAVLLQPSLADYKAICEDVLTKIGFHDEWNGWNNYGQFLSPFCPRGPNNPNWGICDPPQYINWAFHAGNSDQGLWLYYYGLMHDWLLTFGHGYNMSDMRYYRKFGSEKFEGGLWLGAGFSSYRHYKGNKKKERMLADFYWRETMYSAYHGLNMSQIEIFKAVYVEMLQYSHSKPNSWES